nr:fasciclin domain-containing protein [uncultured Niameybacter sp.]
MKAKFNKKLILCLFLVFAMIQISLFAASKTQMPQPTQDIVDIASGNPQFSTLVTALKAAGLVDALKGEGPFTVFAPTNDAFNKLPAGTVEELLKPENNDKLVDILTYHVYPGKVLAADAMKLNGKEVKMLNGKPAKIEVRNGSVFIDGAKVITTDIMAKNGVIHVIDTVMMP